MNGIKASSNQLCYQAWKQPESAVIKFKMWYLKWASAVRVGRATGPKYMISVHWSLLHDHTNTNWTWEKCKPLSLTTKFCNKTFSCQTTLEKCLEYPVIPVSSSHFLLIMQHTQSRLQCSFSHYANNWRPCHFIWLIWSVNWTTSIHIATSIHNNIL